VLADVMFLSDIFENPKSAILIYPLCIKIFAGFKSLWQTFNLFRVLKALQIYLKKLIASVSDKYGAFLFRYVCKSPFSQSSRKK
jgi:hypothetical protein